MRIIFKKLVAGLGLLVFTATGLAGTGPPLTNAVAVLDFTQDQPTARSSDLAAGLEDYFEMALEQQNVPVLERRNIRLILGERDLQTHGLLSAATLSQAGLTAVNYFISGDLACPGGDQFVLTLSIIRADKATVEFTLTRQGIYPNNWLPAIEALAKEVNTRLHLPQRTGTERSEFEEMTWIPEAALPFFKGLDYYSRGDYAAAVPWFRHSYEKDRHFDIARRWEARAYQKLNLPQLASFLPNADINGAIAPNLSKRPVVAVVAGESIPAAGRAAFVQALADKNEFDLFDPAAIGATAREMDLQLTGQMAAPLDGHSVWLVVDDLIYLDAPDASTLVAREQNLLSGEIIRQAKIRVATADTASGQTLARALLKNQLRLKAASPESENILPEPSRSEPGETALPKALRLVQAEPDDARRWIGLADCYGDSSFKNLCLNEAVKAVELNHEQPEAAYWLASALWRKRELSRRIFYEPTARYRAPHPLTNDFAPLLQWFPQSTEAASLTEVTNRGEGSYTVVEPADRRYLAAVYTNRDRVISPPAKTAGSSVAPETAALTVSDEQRFARLKDDLRDGRTAPAWRLANDLHRSSDQATQAQVQSAYDALLQTLVRDRESFQAFTAAAAAGNLSQMMEAGKELLNSANRRQRIAVIQKCAEAVKQQAGVTGQLNYLFTEAKRYRDDFLLDPVTGRPGDSVEYQLLENSTNLVMRVDYGRDYGYEPLMGNVAEMAHDLPPSDLTRKILEYIHNDPALPLEKRLTAAYDLALLEQAQGNPFEALDQLKEVLRQTEGTGLPLKRNTRWSQSIESAAFDALRKIRVYAGSEAAVCDCCGKVPDESPQKPANFDEINAKLAQLWKQQIGEAGTNLPPISQQLLADPENFFPSILYKLRTGQEVSHTLIFCADLGTNALPALPVILQIIHRGEPYQDYNNALAALGALGRAAGCAKPLLILAREKADNGNFKYAFKRIGPAPRRVMPQLAQLLYHQDPEVCKLAAQAMMQTAALKQFKGLSGEPAVMAVRQWWETAGTSQNWGR